jgi:hypothetical protein
MSVEVLRFAQDDGREKDRKEIGKESVFFASLQNDTRKKEGREEDRPMCAESSNRRVSAASFPYLGAGAGTLPREA